MKTYKLTPKQRLFCLEYLVDLNATAAAIRAGYSPKTANEQGSQNLAKLSIKKFIKEKMKDREAKLEKKAEDVIRELDKIGYANIGDYLTFGADGVKLKESKDLTRDQLAAIEMVSQNYDAQGHLVIKFKLFDKPQTLSLLGRHHGTFNDKLQIEGNILRIETVDATKQ